jgi:hypothetical protein
MEGDPMTCKVSLAERVVFVGIDVHSQTYKVHVTDGDQETNWTSEAELEVVKVAYQALS